MEKGLEITVFVCVSGFGLRFVTFALGVGRSYALNITG